MVSANTTPFDLNSLSLLRVEMDGQELAEFFISEDRSEKVRDAIENLKQALGAEEPVPNY